MAILTEETTDISTTTEIVTSKMIAMDVYIDAFIELNQFYDEISHSFDNITYKNEFQSEMTLLLESTSLAWVLN